MKKLFLIFLFLSSAAWAEAQKIYFIIFESAKNVPFYVKLNDKVYSGDNGFVTVSNLLDTTYNFKVGLVANQAHESTFPVSLNGKDRGFLVNNTEEGLQLTDLESKRSIKPEVEAADEQVSYRRKDDVFTTLLAKASDDSNLLWVPVYTKKSIADKKTENPEAKEEKPVAVSEKQISKPEPEKSKEEPAIAKTDLPKQTGPDSLQSLKTDSLTAISHKDTVLNQPATAEVTAGNKNEKTASTEPEKEKPATNETSPSVDSTAVATSENTYKRSQVKKHAESSTTEGFGLVYYDTYEGTTDTIRLMIPNPKFAFRDQEPPAQQDNKQFLDFSDKKDTAATANTSATDQVVKFTDQPAAKEKTGETKDSAQTASPETRKTGHLKAGGHCTSQASENDFLKLRKNMAARYENEEMIAEANKFFKRKCFTSEQIRYLSTLFLSPEGKYRFFDAAYGHVSDPDQFATLATEIKEDYYLKRFKALIGE